MVDSADSQYSKETDRVSACIVTVFTRHGCHLCEVAIETLESMKVELDFTIEKKYIDGDQELERLYGEEVPVTLINGAKHDYFRVDKKRFSEAILRQHQ